MSAKERHRLRVVQAVHERRLKQAEAARELGLSVRQTLSRLVKAGAIERPTRGVFVRPEVGRFVGKVMPEHMSRASAMYSVLLRNACHGIGMTWPDWRIRSMGERRCPIGPCLQMWSSTRRFLQRKLCK